MTRRWPSTSIAGELGVQPATVRDRLDQHGLPTRRRATRRPYRAVQRQRSCWAAKRQARLAELGFADVEGYLRVRRVEQGWSLWPRGLFSTPSATVAALVSSTTTVGLCDVVGRDLIVADSLQDNGEQRLADTRPIRLRRDRAALGRG